MTDREYKQVRCMNGGIAELLNAEAGRGWRLEAVISNEDQRYRSDDNARGSSTVLLSRAEDEGGAEAPAR